MRSSGSRIYVDEMYDGYDERGEARASKRPMYDFCRWFRFEHFGPERDLIDVQM